MMWKYKYKIKLNCTISLTKISTMCMNNIKKEIKYKNTLCRTTLL